MTREEVIRYLETCKKYIDKIRASEGVEVSKEVCMALDMAIKDLENKPRFLVHSDGKIEQIIEHCDDAVSREAFKFDEWDIGDKKAELWVIKGKLQIRHRGTIHNVDFPVLPKCETMQVELEGDGYADGEIVYDSGKCPKCDWKFEDGDKDWEEPFCCHCGQRLHWFDREVKE